MRNWVDERDPDLLSELALAVTQSRMDRALTDSRMSEEDVSTALGKDVRRLLSSNCDLTVKTLGRFLAVCGFKFDVNIRRIPEMAALSAAPLACEDLQLGGGSGPVAPPVGALVPTH